VLVAPMASKGLSAPFCVRMTHAGKKGLFLPYQLRTVHRVRLPKKAGAISPKTINLALDTLQEALGE